MHNDADHLFRPMLTTGNRAALILTGIPWRGIARLLALAVLTAMDLFTMYHLAVACHGPEDAEGSGIFRPGHGAILNVGNATAGHCSAELNKHTKRR